MHVRGCAVTEERTITSTDGTKLSARVTGSGSPLVLVHGSTGSKGSWAFVEPRLAAHHSVWSYDRRGRGQSDAGGEGYSLQAEVDDVLAVLDAVGAPTHLVSHSFGSVCALEAAATGAEIASLTLYEPPVHARIAEAATDRALARLRTGELDAGLAMFLREVVGLSTDELAMIQSIPEVWSRLLDTAPTLERESDALNTFDWDPARYCSITAPTLVLAGECTDAPIYATPEELRGAIPHAEAHVLAGQRHIAFAADPEGTADTVLRFSTRV